MTLATARLLVGRTIVAFDARPFDDVSERGKKIKTCYDPIFTLDSGARVTFMVDETNSGDVYGVKPLYHPKRSDP